MIGRGSVLLAALLLVVACGSSSEVPPGSDQPFGSVTISATEPADSLVPAMVTDAAGGDMVDALWTGLVTYDPVSAEPRLANAHDITTADNRVWTVRLNPGWQFHDGTPVTASSYVNAWNWAAACANHANNQAYFGPAGANIKGFAATAGRAGPQGTRDCPDAPVPLAGLTVVNDSTFTIELESPVAILESILGYWAFAPMPESFFADPEAFGQHPVGNGPFRYSAAVPGQSVTMTSFAAYQGADRPHVAELTWRIFADLDVAYRELRAGSLDILTQMPTTVLAGRQWQSDLGEGRFLLRPAGLLTTLTVPMYDPRFSRPEVRIALSRAIDRSTVIRSVWNDTVLPADSWAPPVVSGYVARGCGDNCTYDAAAARTLLAQGGGFPGALDIAFNSDGGHAQWVGAVCESIHNTLGIPCNPRPFGTQREYLEAVRKKQMAGLFRSTWRMDYPNVQNFLEPLYTTGGASDSGFSDPQFDVLMLQAKALPVPEAIAKYTEGQAILTAAMPAIPLWFGTVQMGWSPRVDSASLVVTPFATVDLTSVRVLS